MGMRSDGGDGSNFRDGRRARGPMSVANLLSASPMLSARSANIALADWRRAVGERLAQKTHPERINDGVLTVRVPSSTWAQELSLLSDVVLERLSAAGHRVQKLRFHVAIGRPVPDTPVTVVRRAALPAALVASISRLDDPELRRAIAEAASLSLARKK
jgi:predicted nucleic acid-binding Zn ribbon protein